MADPYDPNAFVDWLVRNHLVNVLAGDTPRRVNNPRNKLSGGMGDEYFDGISGIVQALAGNRSYRPGFASGSPHPIESDNVEDRRALSPPFLVPLLQSLGLQGTADLLDRIRVARENHPDRAYPHEPSILPGPTQDYEPGSP